MLSVPTVSQMLAVIGVALLALVAVVSAGGVLLDRLTRRTATAMNNTAALGSQAPAPAQATVPSQRPAVTATHPLVHTH